MKPTKTQVISALAILVAGLSVTGGTSYAASTSTKQFQRSSEDGTPPACSPHCNTLPSATCANTWYSNLPENELVKRDGYFVSPEETRARGGVGDYVQWQTRKELDENKRLTQNSPDGSVYSANQVGAQQYSQQSGQAGQECGCAGGMPGCQQPLAPQAVRAPDPLTELRDHPMVFYFPSGAHALNDADRAQLDKIAVELKNSPGTKLEIDGYTDAKGTPKQNLILSAQRAMAAQKYLEAKGIPATQLDARAHGEVQAQAAPSKDQDALDRKVTLSVG